MIVFKVSTEFTFSRSSFCLAMDHLTDDALLEIFSYLSLNDRLRLELVSKRWEQLLKKSYGTI